MAKSTDCEKASENVPILEEAWKVLGESVVTFQGRPVATTAAITTNSSEGKLNYDQVNEI